MLMGAPVLAGGAACPCMLPSPSPATRPEMTANWLQKNTARRTELFVEDINCDIHPDL
jgi:hypothetical protein